MEVTHRGISMEVTHGISPWKSHTGPMEVKSHIPGTQQELLLCLDPEHSLQGQLLPGNQGGKVIRQQLMGTKGAQNSVGGSGIAPELPAAQKGTCLPSEHVMEMFWGGLLNSPGLSGISALPLHCRDTETGEQEPLGA